MGTGYLMVETATAKGLIPVCGCIVTVTNGVALQYESDCSGSIGKIELPTYHKSHSLDKTQFEEQYKVYRVHSVCEKFDPMEVQEVRIFDGCTSLLTFRLMPSMNHSNGIRRNQEENEEQEQEQEQEPEQESEQESEYLVQPAQVTPPLPFLESILELAPPTRERTFGLTIRTPVIPQTISVKLGMPGSNAEVVNVPFVDYLKNVASSELYPTWPEEALRANIHAITSLALNRVFTEWYYNQGHDFLITNTTALDQKYIHNREIYDTISVIVDETFNEFIQRRGNIEPLFAAFCDGRVANCVGLKQWQSVELAEKGMNALEILRYFYGDDIDIVETDQIEDIAESYPGRELTLGSTGSDVFRMERYLTRISIDYPAIPAVYPIYGIFDLKLQSVVEKFQDVFHLPVTGNIGKETWYKISFIYSAVTKLGELASEGIQIQSLTRRFPGVLREGSRGHDVQILQYYLNLLSEFVDTVPSVIIDSRFGPSTRRAVMDFQRSYGLPVTGEVDEVTWLELTLLYEAIINAVPARDELLAYQGTDLRHGDSGMQVLTLQYYLNNIALSDANIPMSITDGYFGDQTEEQVRRFQEEHQLPVTGIIDENTWNQIVLTYSDLVEGDLYPGFDVELWQHNAFVAILEERLNDVARAYHLPVMPVDGFFGIVTRNAISTFQEMFGLPVTGKVNKATWNKIMEVAQSTTTPMEGDENVAVASSMTSNFLKRRNNRNQKKSNSR